jgi:hypothetical protein
MIPLFTTVPCQRCIERSKILQDALAEGKTWFEAINLLINHERELREMRPASKPLKLVGGKLKG